MKEVEDIYKCKLSSTITCSEMNKCSFKLKFVSNMNGERQIVKVMYGAHNHEVTYNLQLYSYLDRFNEKKI